MIISIASGKGGTGKTTLAVGLASYLAEKGKPVSLLDCDVEAPNSNLFLQSDISLKETVYVPVPVVNQSLCSRCGKCEEICQFNAVILARDRVMMFHDLCHSCGGCIYVCPEKAITEDFMETGTIEEGYKNHIHYAGGKLRISRPASPPLIRAVKKHILPDEISIIDSPPGTTCPVIEAVLGSDYVILVTEPTPFGMHDLTLAIDVIRQLKIPFGVVINRSDIGDNRVVRYCAENKIDLLAEIPSSTALARKYSEGNFADYFIKEFSVQLEKITAEITAGSCR